jgi:hypothetical protein
MCHVLLSRNPWFLPGRAARDLLLALNFVLGTGGACRRLAPPPELQKLPSELIYVAGRLEQQPPARPTFLAVARLDQQLPSELIYAAPGAAGQQQGAQMVRLAPSLIVGSRTSRDDTMHWLPACSTAVCLPLCWMPSQGRAGTSRARPPASRSQPNGGRTGDAWGETCSLVGLRSMLDVDGED